MNNNNGNFEESSDIAEPLEIIREEVVVVQNPNEETSLSSLSTSSPSTEEQQEEEEEEENEVNSDNRNSDNEDIYEQIKAQSIQLNSLINMIESLQSQVKQLQETIRLRKHNKTARRKSATNKGMKTKKKTKRRGNAISRRK